MSWKYYLVMVIPSPRRHPLDMSGSNVPTDDRLFHRRFRVPVAVAGVALLALSLVLSVGPAMGAANNSHGGGSGTSGNLKVQDAGTGTETNGTDNEPHVCAFWLGFTFDAPFEAGTWVLVSWAPTGDGSTIASGVYDTTGDGTDSSSILEVPAGHYRVEWAATGASASKKKTFWVDADCGESGSQVEEPASPAEESQAEESQAEESQAEEPASPTEESQAEESQAEEPVSVVDESTSEEQATDSPDDSVADESTTEEPSSAGEEPAAEDPGTPPDESGETRDDAAAEEDGLEALDTGSTDLGTTPAQDVLGGGASDDPTMSDTAMTTTPVPSGLVATMGLLLLLIVARRTACRRRGLDRDLTTGGV
jgi:hypothetical protein